MGKEWILDVLVDLKTFAAANGLPDLERKLEETRSVARVEIASAGKGATIGVYGRDNVSRYDFRTGRAR